MESPIVFVTDQTTLSYRFPYQAMGFNIKIELSPRLPVYFAGTEIRGFVQVNVDKKTSLRSK